MLAIYKRELKSYFQSMIGYAFIAFLMLFMGIYFTAYNLNSGYPYFSYVLSSTMFIFLVAVPVLTMKCFAEERKSKTDQLLLTAPVNVFEIVLGKYLAMVTVFLVPVILSCIYPLVIKAQGVAYLKVDYAAILMYFAIGCVYIAIGMFLSALTESQIIAVVSTFATLLVLYLWSGVLSFLPSEPIYNLIGVVVIILLIGYLIYDITKNWVIGGGIMAVGTLACVITYLVNSSKYSSLLATWLGKLDFATMLDGVISNNLFDVSNLVVCVSVVFLLVFLTVQTIQKRRWS